MVLPEPSLSSPNSSCARRSPLAIELIPAFLLGIRIRVLGREIDQRETHHGDEMGGISHDGEIRKEGTPRDGEARCLWPDGETAQD